jgi:hypothetical protein
MNSQQALAKIQAAIARHRKLFDLEEEGLGKALCKAVTDGVQATIDAQTTPDGSPWPELSEDYQSWKSKHYPGQPMAVLYGVMAKPSEVEGEVEVQTEQASVVYGVTDEARIEAGWFQKRRKFWGFTERSRGEVRLLLDSRFATA